MAEKAKTLIILGDLTDEKDYHPAQLVNRLTKAIEILTWLGVRVIILKGNHDYLKDGHMFFQFLDALPNVEVISKPFEDTLDGGRSAMFLPYTKTPARDWKGWDFSHYQYLFMHQTVTGSIASNGQKMDGEALPPLNAGKVYSGDIHVPQIVGEVEYIGSPYHVHFGDRFKPRAIVLDRDGKAFDLHYPALSRVMLDVEGEEGTQALAQLKAGDQVKIRVHLSEAEKHLWREERAFWTKAAADFKLQLCGLELKVKKSRRRIGTKPGIERVVYSPAQSVVRFVEADDLGGELLDVGLECLE